ncbi:MAG: YciI family protein [Gammaproteobacteria bacterium]|nr:YciI family protein [Gammaproteobacteria bacterium]
MPEVGGVAYLALCRDNPACNSGAIRAAELQAHLDYVATLGGQLLLGGPLRLGGNEHYNASLFIYDVDSPRSARELLEGDPYFRAQLYAEITLAEFTPARGRWLTELLQN